jgi:hypothetical protein
MIEAAGMTGLRLAGWSVNLSRGGLALRFFGALDPGVQVRVTLHRGTRPALMCVGRVAWVDRSFRPGDGSAGIAFSAALTGDMVADIAAEALPASEETPGRAAGES